MLNNILDSIFKQLSPPVLNSTDLSVINSFDFKDLQEKLEVAVLGMYKDPMLLCSTGDILLHSNITKNNIPKHHLIVDKSKRVHLSAELGSTFIPGYYMSDAVDIKSRSIEQRFDGNKIAFMNGVLQSVEFNANRSSLFIDLLTEPQGNNNINNISSRFFSFDIPKTSLDVQKFSTETGIDITFFQMYYDFMTTSYGRRKMPNFFWNNKFCKIDPIYNIYKK